MQRVQKKTKNICDPFIFFKKWYYLIKKNQTAFLQHIINMEGSCFFYEKSLGTDAFLLWAWNGSAFLCSGDYIYFFLCDRVPDPWI